MKLFFRRFLPATGSKKLLSAAAIGGSCLTGYHFFKDASPSVYILPTLSDDLERMNISCGSTQSPEIAVIYAQHGHLETAVDMLKVCAESTRDPEQVSDIYYALAKALWGLGKTNEAGDYMRAAFEQNSANKPFLVVGAGSSGCEIGKQLAERDERVVVIEMDDGIGKGATDASSGLLWFSAYMKDPSYFLHHIPESIVGIKDHLQRGAPRYTEPVDLDILVKSPSLIQALFQIAKYESAVMLYFCLMFLGMGTQSYARLPNFTPANHYPGLKQDDLWGTVQITEAGFVNGKVREAVTAVAQTANDLGADFFCHHKYVGSNISDGEVTALVQNMKTGEIGEFPVRHILFATNADTEQASHHALPHISCVSGDHIYIKASLVQMNSRGYAAELSDGRRMFILREDDEDALIKIGTTEYPGIRPNGASATEKGVDYLLEHANTLLQTKTGQPLTLNDVIKSTGGTRTVVNGARSSHILKLNPHMTAVLCTKLTTVVPTIREMIETFTDKPLRKPQCMLSGNGIPDPIGFAKNCLYNDFDTFRLSGETVADFQSVHLNLIHTYREAYRRVLELRQEDPDSYQELYEHRYLRFLEPASSVVAPCSPRM